MSGNDTDNKQVTKLKPQPFTLRQQAFFKSDAALLAKNELKLMLKDPKYNTRGMFSARHAEDVPFVDHHMKYLSEHPKLDPRHYLANLKLMSKFRGDKRSYKA